MRDQRVALVTGANQGVGLQVAKELVANGLTVLVASRNVVRGEAAAKEIGPGAILSNSTSPTGCRSELWRNASVRSSAASICSSTTQPSRIPERALYPSRSTGSHCCEQRIAR